MYGELRIALNNVASQFGQLALQLEESDHTKARAVINNVKKLHEIDDYCAAHFFARNTESLIKALAFNTSDYDDDFINAVMIGATGYACGYYNTIGAPETTSPARYLAENVVIRNKLGKHIPLKEIESAYSDLRSICGWIADEYPDDARERMEKAVSVLDAADVFYDLCCDYAIVDVGDIGEINRERFPVERKLLRYIDCQMSRMNYEHAAVCMINWLPELEKMTGYVSRETSLAFKCAKTK